MQWDNCNRWPRKDNNHIKILSIDGGGTRGIFPAKYLAQIEGEIGKPIYSFFDLIVGTSTGGIIALGLAAGVSAKEIADLYVNHAKEIFKPNEIEIPKGKLTIASKFLNDNNKEYLRVNSKYTSQNLELLLKETLGELIIDNALSRLCIPSVEHNKAVPKVFKTPHNSTLHTDKELLMWKVGLATSAAPIYFPPACTTGNDCKIDGGLWANNPVLVAITEAVQHGYNLNEIKVLSIGTGKETYSATSDIAEKSSLIGYGTNILDLFFASQSQGTLYTAKHLLSDNLTRIDFITPQKIGLDSVEKSDIKLLLNEAEIAFAKTYLKGENVREKFFIHT